MKHALQALGTLLILAGQFVPAKTIFVSKSGSDGNPGTQVAPYLTISKAAAVVVAGDVVKIAKGTYRETVTPANHGTAASPIVFEAMDGDTVIVSATKQVTGWSVHKGNIYKASIVMDRGIANMVYFNGEAMDLARWPNNSDANPYTIDAHPIVTGGSGSHLLTSGVPTHDWTGGYLWYLGAHSGASWTRPLTSVTATQVNFTTVDITKWPFDPHNPTVFRNGNRGRFYLLNALGALDYAREWYYNSGILYFQAPGNANPSTATVEVAEREMTFNLAKNHIHVKGITAFGGKVFITGDYVTFENNIVRHGLQTLDNLNNTGAQVTNGAVDIAGDYAVVTGCLIEYGSLNGVAANQKSRGGIGTRIENNVIRHFNTVGNHSSLIRLTVDNAKILRNTAYSTGRDGVYMNGYNGEMAYNDLYDVMKINNDGGVFYTVGNTESKNNILHHNWLHDSYGPKYADGRAAGIYLDNDSKGYTVHHNVVWNVTWSGFQTNWDVWDNQFYNNTLWNVSDAMGAWLPKRDGYQTSIQRTKIYNNYASKEEFLGTDLQNNIIDANSPFVNLTTRDFRPKAGSKLINAGRTITGFTTGSLGTAPDIGAYESGATPWVAGAKLTAICSNTWYQDTDMDGVGDASKFQETCKAPMGYVRLAGDICPADPTKTTPGDCGCGVAEGTCKDDVQFTQKITMVPSITNISVDLDYMVTQDRDLVLVLLDGNGAWVGNKVETVKTGSGTKRMVFGLAKAPTVGPSYRLDAYIRPVGGDIANKIDFATVNVTVVASGTKDCAGIVNGSAMVDACGVCSGGTTSIPVEKNVCSTTESIDFAEFIGSLNSQTSYEIDVKYQAGGDRDVVVILKDSAGTWLGNGIKTVQTGSATVPMTLKLAKAPAAGSKYQLSVALRAVGDNTKNIDQKELVIQILGGGTTGIQTSKSLDRTQKRRKFNTLGQERTKTSIGILQDFSKP